MKSRLWMHLVCSCAFCQQLHKKAAQTLNILAAIGIALLVFFAFSYFFFFLFIVR